MSVTIADKDRDRVVILIGYGEIDVTVIVEVRRRDRRWCSARTYEKGRLERAVAVTEKNASELVALFTTTRSANPLLVNVV